jgi:hypothetical protein
MNIRYRVTLTTEERRQLEGSFVEGPAPLGGSSERSKGIDDRRGGVVHVGLLIIPWHFVFAENELHASTQIFLHLLAAHLIAEQVFQTRAKMSPSVARSPLPTRLQKSW